MLECFTVFRMENHNCWNSTGECPRSKFVPNFFLIKALPDAISICIKLFADVGKLFSRVKSEDKRTVVQDNITTTENWAETWKMFQQIKMPLSACWET